MSISLPFAVTMMIGTRRPRPDLAAHVDARHLRQHHVEQHEIGRHGVEQVERLTAVSRDLDAEALTPQTDRQRLDERVLVLDDEHGQLLGHGAHPASAVVVTPTGPGPAGMVECERRALALLGLHPDLTAVVGGNVADDGEAETGAAGLAAAGAVDPVEAFEDALEVALGDADALVGDGDVDRLAIGRSGHGDRGVLVGVLDRVVEQVADRGHELPPLADDREARARLDDLDLDAPQVRALAHPVDGLGDHQVHGDGLADRRALDLDATQLEEVVDRATDAVRLVHESLGQALTHALVVFRVQRLREQRECADRRLQLVADVRDEVGAHRFETCALGDVVDRAQRADDRTCFLERRHRDDDRSPRRTEEIDGATIGHASTARGEELGDRLLDQRVAVTRADEGRGVDVAEHDAAGAIGDHDSLRERVERRRETIARCDRVGLARHGAIGGAPESIDRRGQRGRRLQDLPAEPRRPRCRPAQRPAAPGTRRREQFPARPRRRQPRPPTRSSALL